MRSPSEAIPLESTPTRHPPRPLLSRRALARRHAGAVVADGFFWSVAHGARLLPLMHPRVHRLELLQDIPYIADGSREHLLDIYRPVNHRGSLPVIFYVHGGGFRVLSKETHRIFALAFARRGYLVVSINYRLAPRHPFPAAHADTCAAWLWTLRHIAEYGGDPLRIGVAGESAGGNLATSLTIAACLERPEHWAREVFDAGVVPMAAIPACGILQVSDPERFLREKPLHPFIHDRLAEVGDAYLAPVFHRPMHELEMADPVCIIERTQRWDRPLPPFFAPVGTRDPLVDDTRRLERALHRQGVTCDARYYDGEPHAFHGFVFTRNARQCWRHKYAFLDQHFPAGAAR